jgi:hypothetical protein
VIWLGNPLLLLLLALYDASENALQNTAGSIGRTEHYERLFADFIAREIDKHHTSDHPDQRQAAIDARDKHKGAELPDLWLADRGVQSLGANGIKIMLKRRGLAASLTGVHAQRWRHNYAHEWKRVDGVPRRRPPDARRRDQDRAAVRRPAATAWPTGTAGCGRALSTNRGCGGDRGGYVRHCTP